MISSFFWILVCGWWLSQGLKTSQKDWLRECMSDNFNPSIGCWLHPPIISIGGCNPCICIMLSAWTLSSSSSLNPYPIYLGLASCRILSYDFKDSRVQIRFVSPLQDPRCWSAAFILFNWESHGRHIASPRAGFCLYLVRCILFPLVLIFLSFHWNQWFFPASTDTFSL